MRRARSAYIYRFPTSVDPDNIVRALLSGVDIAFVDPNLYTYITPSVQRMKAQYEYENEVKIVRELEFIEDYMKKLPRRKMLEAVIPQEQPPPKKKRPPAFTDEELECEIQELMRSDVLKNYTAEQAEDLMNEMKCRKEQFIDEMEYLLAEVADNVIKKLYTISQLATVKEMQDEKADELKEKIRGAEKKLVEAKEKWERVYEKLKKTVADEFLAMEEEHNAKIEEINNMRDAEPPAAFKKYSATLLDMRAKQKAMVKMKDFLGASEMKERADRIQIKENQNFYVKWNKKIDALLKEEKKSYTTKINSRRLFWKKEEENLVRDAEEEVALQERAIQIMKESLGTLNNAKKVTKTVLNDTKQFHRKVKDLNEKMTPEQHGQKRLVNRRIYTITPRKRKTHSSQLPSIR